MAYTCAVSPTADASLEQAQEEKFDLVCRKLGLQPGMRLLDVGCGWGGMVRHAVKHYGVTAIGVTLSLPLFSGFATQNRIQETLKLEDKASNDLEGVRRSIAQSTRSAFLGVQSGLAQVKAYEAAEASNKLSLEATQLGYKVGVRVNLDVLTAQTQLFNTEQQLSKARYDVIMGDLKLRQVTGQLGDADIQRVNGLLAR